MDAQPSRAAQPRSLAKCAVLPSKQRGPLLPLAASCGGVQKRIGGGRPIHWATGPYHVTIPAGLEPAIFRSFQYYS